MEMKPRETNADSSNGQCKGLPSDEEGDTVGSVVPLDPATQCGLGSFHPSWLHNCANMKSFTAVLSCVTVFGSMNFSYYTAVITQIEKQFGLSSSVTGFIKNVDNIGYMSTVLLVAHFCRYSNKPRLFACSIVGVSAAIFLFAMPHFIYGAGNLSPGIGGMNASLSEERGERGKFEYCGENSGTTEDGECRSRSYLSSFNTGALVIFIVSELLQGIALSPKLTLSITYMDDNAKNNSPKYFGFLFATRAMAPVLGFLLGAWTTSIYVDLSDPGLSKRDPRWVGAWWLGFVICAVCSVVWAVPMSMFPSKTLGDSAAGEDGKALPEEPGKQKLAKDFKDLPKAIGRLLRNPVFVFMLAGCCFNSYLVGFFTFQPKYLETYFGYSASFASVLTGVFTSFGWALGPIISGRIMASIKTTPSSAMKMILILEILAGFGCLSSLVIICPDGDWAGTINVQSPNLTFACNAECGCDPLLYTPVCGADGVNYYSPCYAGCQGRDSLDEDKAAVFHGCACIDGGTAVEGLCESNCRMIILYLTIMAVTSLLSSMTMIPMIMALMRCVDYRDKALSIALFSFVAQIVSFPAPAAFGLAIDSTCLAQQASCTRKGACLLYDKSSFRIRLHGMAVLLKIGATFSYAMALYVSRNKTYEQCVDAKPSTTGQTDAQTDDTAVDEKGSMLATQDVISG